MARWLIVLLFLGGAVTVARADEHVYLGAGDAYQWATALGPLPEVSFGSAAARALLAPSPSQTLEPPPLAYQAAALLPLTLDTSRGRVTALYLRRSFAVGEEAENLRILTLRARYADALVVSINGNEIARRNLALEAPPTAPAGRLHGPEWESFYVTVVPGLLHPGENDVEVEVRPSVVRLAPSVELELTGSEVGRIVRGPVVQRVGVDAATIVFETDLPTVGGVRWGTAASSYDKRVDDSEPSIRHVLRLEGLPHDQEIHYQALAGDDETSGDEAFHLAPARGDVVRFVVYGDVRGGHETHAEIARAALGEAPDFVVSTGDMVLRGSDEADWQRYFDVSRELLARVPVYPVIGNHDMGGGGAGGGRRMDDAFALPDRPPDCPPGAAWYSFDVGNVHFVLLDSNRYDDERQLTWMKADLATARLRGARAIFAAAHQGPASRGPHGGDPTAAARYVPALVAAGASEFFSGHDHLYERGDIGGLGYVVSGGGGAPLYTPRCGTPGRPACKPDGARTVVSVHHYLVVEVYRDYFRMCAKKPDGTLIEACVQKDL